MQLSLIEEKVKTGLVMRANDLLEEAKIFDYEFTDLLEWAIDNKYIKPNEEVNLTDKGLGLSQEIRREYRQNKLYDVVLYSKGGGRKKVVTNKGVTLEEARKICSSPASKGQNYFAGFTTTGRHKNTTKGDKFIIRQGEVINPRES